MFLTVKHCLSESKRSFDLRLVRLIIVSVFRSSPGHPVNFGLRTNLDVRFDSLDFGFSAWAFVTSVSIDTRHLCLHDAAVRHFK